jgi:hypothetical protein
MVVASVLIVLGATELGIRLFRVAPLPETAAGGFRPDHPLLRVLRPHECKVAGGLSGPFAVEVCTNGLGLRDRDHPPGESPRVLGIGDSFTFGWGIEQNDTFLAHLERALRIGLPTVRPGVWNAGLSYTSQVHQDVLLRYLYEKVRPDAVVLAFAEDNDIDENIIWNPNLGVFPERGEIPPGEVAAYRDTFRDVVFQDFLFRHSATVRFFRQRHLRASVAAEAAALDSRLQAHGFAGAPLSRMVVDEARRRFMQAFSNKYDDDWRVTEILLERIRQYVSDRGAKLVLVRIPSRMSVEEPAWQAAQARFCGPDPETSKVMCGELDRGHTAKRLSAYAKSKSLPYVDAESDLRAAAARGESLYIPEDIHLSQLGHARIAEHVAEVVVPLLGGKAPAVPPVRAAGPPKERLVGAYWYPWYRATDWTSFTDFTPKGGAYVSSNPDAIAGQIQQAERGEIDFFMIELLADHNQESKFNNQGVDAMVNAIAERRRRGFSKMRFAMLTDIFVGEADIATPERWLDATRRHLDQIWTRFVEPYRDAYLQVDGKPLVGVFSPPAPIDDARFTLIRPYWVSHEQWKEWNGKKEWIPFWDTVPQAITDRRFVSVIPGYNDWRLERKPQVGPYLPRLGGRTFIEQWRQVFEIDPEVVLVYSFNEFFEQTHIQPTEQQADRYLVLTQLLARRFKDGRPFRDSDAKLADVLEPPRQKGDENVAWLPVNDPRLTSRGLEPAKDGLASFKQEAELEFDVESPNAFVLGVAHPPSFERCAGISVTIAGSGPDKTDVFSTELTQLSILRDSPLPKTADHVKMVLRRVPATDDCRDSGERPIVISGITRYPLATSERSNLRVDDPTVHLKGFYQVETPPQGSFAWSRDRSLITLSGLTPGARHRVTLSFRDTAGFSSLEIGPDETHMSKVELTPGRTATLAEPLVVSQEGNLDIHMKAPTWSPHERFGSEDPRVLGLALRLITLDRLESANAMHERR